MRRIPARVLLAPVSIYQHAAHYGEGYRPTAGSRFAVVRTRPDAAWVLVHIRSGMPVESLLPALPRKLTMTDKLNVAAAFEAATHLDWSALDAVPQVEEGAKKCAGLGAMNPSQTATVGELRRIAANLLA